MNLSRRDLLKFGGAASAVAGLGGCAFVARRLPKRDIPESLAPPSGDVDATVRLVNRAGFGPRPGEIAEVRQVGHEAWVDRQLTPAGDQDLRLTAQLMRLDVVRLHDIELRDIAEDEIVRQLNQAALLRQVYSGDTLFERMVDFWSNHFNVYARKGESSYRVAQADRDVIRPHALGTFPDLLKASAHSPAMLGYLDNQISRKENPNENYARELMELHTLGVKSGYTQQDVREVARCFTGWTIERRFLHPKGQFRFNADLHDDGEKLVLGHVIPAGGGETDGDLVLDLLASDPRTASFISGKMCRHFLGDKNHAMRARLATIYRETGGDIKAMLKPLLLSAAALHGPAVAKRPVDFVVSSLRALGAESDCGPPLQAHLANMGQSLYEWPMPDGYPDGAEPWTGSLLARWNFALALGQNRIRGTDLDVPSLFERTHLDSPVSAAQALTYSKSHEARGIDDALANRSDPDPAHLIALAIAAPEFQWR